MENRIKKLVLGIIVSFILMITIWGIIALITGDEGYFNKIMIITSFIPMSCLVVFGSKLINLSAITKYLNIR